MDGIESKLADAPDQTWLIDLGHAIIERKRVVGLDVLIPRERVILCLWTIDYSMRNAGDLAAARDIDANCLADGLRAASALGAPRAMDAFAMSEGELERRYFDLFDGLCAELRRR